MLQETTGGVSLYESLNCQKLSIFACHYHNVNEEMSGGG